MGITAAEADLPEERETPEEIDAKVNEEIIFFWEGKGRMKN